MKLVFLILLGMLAIVSPELQADVISNQDHAHTQSSSTENEGQRLIAIDFLSTSDQPPLIKLSLVERTSYRLVRSRARIYTLFIPDCQIDEEYLELPYFPPQDFPGIRFVTAKQQEDDVEVTIGVDEGVRISSFVQDNDIFLRTSAP